MASSVTGLRSGVWRKSDRTVARSGGACATVRCHPLGCLTADDVPDPQSALAEPRLAGGCHLARDTTTAIERAGFQIETFERFRYSPASLLPSDPHVLGVARRA